MTQGSSSRTEFSVRVRGVIRSVAPQRLTNYDGSVGFRGKGAVFCVIGPAAWASGCLLYPDGFSGGTAPGVPEAGADAPLSSGSAPLADGSPPADGPPADGSPPVNGGDGGGPAPGSVLRNGDFES